MTKKLFNAILATCLIFGSLYLPAHADEAKKAPSADDPLPVKKSPEAHFLDGNTCLTQSNIACATIALANIPSLSPYAKLLQGSIALHDHRIDESLLLLLPLQAEKNLIPEASIRLHEQLATAFESLDDIPQTIGHLILAESTTHTSAPPDSETKIAAIQQKIWALLNKQEQSQLISMRGDNTDNDFQGWVDLCLAAKNQDLATGVTDWAKSYPDHSATAFAKTLKPDSSHAQSKIMLANNGSIALILPPPDETNTAKAAAFKQGLLSALIQHDMLNEIQIYAGSDTAESIAERYALAKSEGAAYFIVPDFNLIANEVPPAGGQNTNDNLHIGLFLKDEAQRITNFAHSHAIQHIVIVAADNEAAQQMTTSFRSTWQTSLGLTDQNDQIQVIKLPDGISSGTANLLDLKTQIAAVDHDMLLLAMSAQEARTVKPHLNISTPTMAFSSIHDTNDSDTSLNAVRFIDIPFLLPSDNDAFKAYQKAGSNLNSNELLRWFALGVDALPLLAASQQANDKEVIINGLTGILTVDKTGNIQRQPSIARFTFDGIELEK